MGTTPNAAQLVGANVRRLRDWRSQDVIAQKLTTLGLRWTQATVAAVETGRRQIHTNELPLLCVVLYCKVGDLFEGGPTVELVAGRPVRTDVVRRMLAGDGTLTLGDIGHRSSRPMADVAAGWTAQAALYERLAPGLKMGELVDAEDAASREAERKAARKLGVSAVVVAVAAFGLWRCSLTDERDARVKNMAPEGTPARSVQALRGRVTRELVELIRTRIEAQEG